jgi:hypothetical protein
MKMILGTDPVKFKPVYCARTSTCSAPRRPTGATRDWTAQGEDDEAGMWGEFLNPRARHDLNDGRKLRADRSLSG